MFSKKSYRRVDHLGAESMLDWRHFPPERRTEDNQQPIKDVMPEMLKRLGLLQRFQQEDMGQIWGEIVGPLAAAHSKPISLKKGVLIISVAQPAIQWTLHSTQATIISRLQARFGAEMVKTVRFQAG
jgi:predicted nucleic acid-binding Zn ribbon protein